MSAAPPLPLSQDVAQDFKRAVKIAAFEAVRASSSSSSQLQGILTRGLRACFEEALSELSSAFNAENTLLGRLSNELWCIAFAHLSVTDLVSATQVCQKWRAIALADPLLWCTIEFMTGSHEDGCDCQCHLPVEKEGLIRPQYGCIMEGPGSSNLKMVKAALSLCGSVLPLSLSVDVEADLISYSELERLSRVLQPHLPRLVVLKFTSQDSDAHKSFLDNFDSLPALRTLSIWCSSSSGSLSGAFFLHNHALGLPMLKNLSLDIDCEGDVNPPEVLPALEKLELRYGATDDILTYLTISPRLRHLCLRPPIFPYSAEPQAAYKRVRKHAQNIETVEVRDIYPAIEPRIIAMFDNEAHSDINFGYRSIDNQGLGLAGARILRHLGCVDELSITCPVNAIVGHEHLIISARNQQGKVRTLRLVWQPETVASGSSDLWSYLAAPPRSLVVEARLWSNLGQLPSQMAAGIKNLTVFVSPGLHLAALAGQTPNLYGALAALEDVTIAGHVWADAPLVASSHLLSFLKWLCANSSLKRLMLHSVKVDGSTAQLEAVASTVVLQ